jgi:uncharacterized membrane protein required for colicin V production
MNWDADTLENIYYAGAALLVSYLAWNGWRQGVVRQAMTIFAIASAYAVAWFGARPLAPMFSFLRYPQPLTIIISGVAGALITLIVINTVSRAFFKRTKETAKGTVRMSYGIFGALLGLTFGLVIFVFASEAVRLLGTLAQSNVEAVEERQREAIEATGKPSAQIDVSPVVRSLAKLGGALDDGGSGTFFRKVDPVPAKVFATLTKLGVMASRPEAVDRFLSYPGIDQVANHPKLLALRADPQVSDLLLSKSYFRLLRHEKVVALAADQEFASQITRMDFDKALDFALAPPSGTGANP